MKKNLYYPDLISIHFQHLPRFWCKLISHLTTVCQPEFLRAGSFTGMTLQQAINLLCLVHLPAVSFVRFTNSAGIPSMLSLLLLHMLTACASTWKAMEHSRQIVSRFMVVRIQRTGLWFRSLTTFQDRRQLLLYLLLIHTQISNSIITRILWDTIVGFWWRMYSREASAALLNILFSMHRSTQILLREKKINVEMAHYSKSLSVTVSNILGKVVKQVVMNTISQTTKWTSTILKMECTW